MTSVMGPGTVNKEKFTPWSIQQKVLGLRQSTRLTRTSYRSLLGSLRLFATCIRPARALLQRLRVGEPQLQRQSQNYLTAAMRNDLV
ncbi:hypothetical protein PHMEG_00025921 [Phytophthora megakarya]|uniref:Uncharacterized protein n=1 Tax=Phytophthora megakarya TaxID=4795 RepID=A0A225VAY1_9STRA|nr:hypothetical protein PHMEG_00025921 [Phytophthora megakarya]